MTFNGDFIAFIAVIIVVHSQLASERNPLSLEANRNPLRACRVKSKGNIVRKKHTVTMIGIENI